MVSVIRPSKCPLTVMVQSSKESLNSTFQLCFYRKHYKKYQTNQKDITQASGNILCKIKWVGGSSITDIVT